MEVDTRKRDPLEWARAQNYLGLTLRLLGARGTGTERFEQAVQAHRAALEIYTRERFLLYWAQTQIHLGNALWSLSKRRNQPQWLKEALEATKAARKVYMDAGIVQYEAYFMDRIGVLEAEIAALEER